MSLSRRSLLYTAAAAALPAEGGARVSLGCETLPYRAHPLRRALEGIQKAGYRFVMPFSSHAGKAVFAPSLSAAGGLTWTTTRRRW